MERYKVIIQAMQETDAALHANIYLYLERERENTYYITHTYIYIHNIYIHIYIYTCYTHIYMLYKLCIHICIYRHIV